MFWEATLFLHPIKVKWTEFYIF